MEFAEGMKRLTKHEAKEVFDRIGTAACGLKHLVYSNLKKTKFHRFGVLRLWPKFKSFKGNEGSKPRWSDMKWRPLVSYKKHRWRKVLALLSRL